MEDLIKGVENNLIVGTFVSNSDGITQIDSLGLANCDHAMIIKPDYTVESLSVNSYVPCSGTPGSFKLLLTNSNCSEYGRARVSIVDSSYCLPVWKDVQFVDSAYYGVKETAPALADAVGSLDTRVTSIAIEVDSVQAQVTSVYDRLGDFPVSGYLPSSETLDAHIATLPTSQTLNAHILTLPTSEELNDHVLTLPTSEELDVQIGTLPISGYVPSSSALHLLDDRVSSLDIRVSSLDIRVSSQFYTEIESGYPFIEKQRIDMAVFTGITSGGGTTTLIFRDVADSKDRLVVTVDSDQNRTSIDTLDGS